MKKYLFFAVVALVASAACTKVETEVPDQKITFQTANYVPSTRAGEVSVLNDFNEFKCKAFLHAVGVDLDADGNIITTGSGKPSFQDFFGTAETISPYNASGAKLTNLTSESTGVSYWAPSHEYYWPKSAKSYVNFVGWYGTGNGANNDPNVSYAYVSNKWKATLEWSFSNATIGAAGANLLYADMAWRYNDNPNAEYKKNGLANDYKGVPMLFHHALAQISLKAYASSGSTPALTAGTGTVTDNVATWTIKLKNVTINGVYTAGTLTLTNEDPGTATTKKTWDGGWSTSGTAGTMTVSDPFTVQKVTKATAENVFNATCVLPQDLANATLTFDLEIKTAYTGGVENTEIIPQTITLPAMTTGGEWVQNTKYTYYLNINPSQKTVRFDPALIQDWTDGTIVDQTI